MRSDSFSRTCPFRTHGLSHFLDSRFKDNVVPNPVEFRAACRNSINQEVAALEPITPEVRVVREFRPPSKKRSFIGDAVARYAKDAGVVGQSSSQPVNRVDDLDREMAAYMQDQLDDEDSDPLAYWKVHTCS